MQKVSIIVTVYNTEKYLEKCFESLVNQTYKDLEIIVINDGSTDNSLEIINNYAKKYKSLFKVYTTKNNGRANARNLGISKVNTDFFMFIDSDDYIDLNMISEMMEKMDNDTDIVVCDAIRIIDGKEEKVLKFFKDKVSEKNKALMISHPGPCAKIYRTKLFKDNNLLFPKNVRLYEDLAVIPLLGLYTDKIKYINKPFYKYVIHHGSALRQTSFNKNINDIFIIMDLLSKKIPCEYKDELEFIYIEHFLRTASLRYAEFEEGKNYIIIISDIMHKKYPNYYKNKYYRGVSYKFKILCFLAYHKYIFLLKIIKRMLG